MPDGQATGFVVGPAAGSALVVGQVESVVGACSLTRPDGGPFQAKVGDPVCCGDILETTAGGKIGIRFTDGTAFNLSDRARAVVKEFGCDGAEPSALFDISRGTFAFIAGEMAKRGGLRIETPFGSIRGRAQSGGIGMLSLASLFFAALENAQGLTLPPGFEDGVINIRDSSDIINAPFGIIELTVGGRTYFIDNPFEEFVVRGTSVSQVPLSLAQLAAHQVESNNVAGIAAMGQGPTVGGPSGSGGLPPPEPPPFVTPINNVVPTGPTGPTGGQGQGNNGGAAGAPQDIPPPPPPPPLPPPGPNEINEIVDTTGNPTVHETSGSIPSAIVSLNSPTFTWTGGPITNEQKALLADIVWSGGPLTDAQKATVAAATTLPPPGSTTFDFEIVDSAVDFVAFGETVKLTYLVTFSDGSTQPVTVTVFGTNDLPEITSGAQSGSATETADNAAGENVTVHHQSDTITFADVDLTNIETSAVSGRQVTSATLANGLTLTAAQQNALLSAFSVDPATHSSSNGNGTVTWHYDISDSALDFLGANDHLTLTFTVRVSDGFGGVVTQDVVITVNGTEDAPVITSAAQSGSITEIADNAAGENATVHHQSDTVTFTDVDLSDIEASSVTARQVTSATLANGYTLTAAQQNALLNAFSVDAATHSQADGTGKVVWHYDISDSALDFLGDNDQLTLTFTVQVNDGHGGTTSQNVVITVNGTEDAPVITSGAQSGSVKEIADGAAGENTTIHHQSGTVTFTDVDLSDVETGSVILRQVTSTNLANNFVLTAAQQNAFLNAFTIDAATHSQANGTGTVGWHYDISDGALDFLGDDDQVTLTFTVQVADGHGGFASQNVVITVNGGISGTEDAPVITSGPQSGTVSEIADNAAGENVTVHHQSDTITFTDVDLSDLETSSVTARQVTGTTLANGYTLTTAQQNALLNAFSVDAATHSQADGTGTVVWHYDLSDGALDFLGDDDQVTLTFTVQVADGHGGFASQNVVITVNGTEDKPVVTSGAQSGSVTEVADNAPGENVTVHHQSGTVTFTDVDLSDGEASSVTARQVTGTTLANGYTLTAAQQTALLNAFSVDAATHSQADGTGTVGWHYDLSDGALEFLGDDDQLTLTFTVQVADGHGGFASQNVVVTVNGTEDVPVITSGAQSGSVTEIADNAPGENVTVHHQSGTVTFTDVDLSDGETSSVTARQVTGATLANGSTLTAAQQNALLNAFSVDAATHLQTNGTGTVGWHYDPSDSVLDFLGDDDQLTLTFTVQVADDHGGFASQNVVITVNGTEDKPVVTPTSNSFAELAGTNNLNTDSVSGSIGFNDVDLSDRPSVSAAFSSFTYTAADGITALSLTSAQQAAILHNVVLGPTPPNTSSGAVTWTYSVADNALDFLAQNETLKLTYIGTVDDHHGGIISQPFTVTIQGTNDAPVIKSAGSYSLDQFNTQDYGGWVEVGNNSNGAVNGSPLNGEFQVAHDPTTAAGNFQIYLSDLDSETDVPDTLTRTYNLVGAGNTAALDFDYRRNIPSAQSDDHFDVLVSINGGAFALVGNIGSTINGTLVDASYQHFHFDLSLPAGQTIQSIAVRFSVGDDVDDGDIVYVDNVKLSYPTTAASTQTINYTENSAVGLLPPQITDADHNATIQSAKIQLTDHQVNDLLSITGALPGSISASSYNAATGVLTLSGTASLADYQNALSHILFSNTGDDPSTADRHLTITVNDGLADSNLVTTTIHVTSVNDPPVATADNVITNFAANTQFQIPHSALLANDTDPDSLLTVSSVGNTSGLSATNGSGVVNVTDPNPSGGSFDYTASDGGATPSTAHVTVNRVSGTTLTGTNADDILVAAPNTSSPTTMTGGNGNDVLIGNTGINNMDGGAGNDTFVFRALTDSKSGVGFGIDTITGFTPGADHLDFTAIAGVTNVQGVTGLNTVAAHSVSWFNDGSQTIVYVNASGNPNQVDMEIHLTGTNIPLPNDILHHT
jgi:VCBS repeat-containing protein